MAPPRVPPPDLPLRELLVELGYGGRNEAMARHELELLGLTRAGKQRIASTKRERVAEVLRERFLLLCGRPACRESAFGERRQVLQADRPSDCALCGGSGNRQAVDRLCAAFALRGIERVVIIGGSPSVREALRALLAGRVEVRLVDGTERRTLPEARADLRWAQLVVIWGGTELDHRVSMLYTGSNEAHVVAVHRRGIAALADEVRAQLERLPAARDRR